MTKFWIAIFAVTCAFLAQGNSSWLGQSSRERVPVPPQETEGTTTGDFIGHDDPISGEKYSHIAPKKRATQGILWKSEDQFESFPFVPDDDDNQEGKIWIDSSGEEDEKLPKEKYWTWHSFAVEKEKDHEDSSMLTDDARLVSEDRTVLSRERHTEPEDQYSETEDQYLVPGDQYKAHDQYGELEEDYGEYEEEQDGRMEADDQDMVPDDPDMEREDSELEQEDQISASEESNLVPDQQYELRENPDDDYRGYEDEEDVPVEEDQGMVPEQLQAPEDPKMVADDLYREAEDDYSRFEHEGDEHMVEENQDTVPDDTDMFLEDDTQIVPEDAHVAPGDHDAHIVLDDAHMVPDDALMVPDDEQEALEGPHMVLDDAHMVPDDTHMVPDDELEALEDPHMVPDDAHIVPDDAHIVPANSYMVLDDAHMVPNDAHILPDDAQMMPDDQQETLEDPHMLTDDFYMAQEGDDGEYEDEQGAHIVPDDQDEVPEEDRHKAPEDRHMLADDLYVEQDDYSGYGDEDEEEIPETDGDSGNHGNADEENDDSKGSSSHEEQATFEEEEDKLDKVHPYSMPQSDIRWRSLNMAHVRRRDSPVNTYNSKRNRRKRGTSPIQATSMIFIAAGAVFIVLLMAAFFIFAWPIRKYYRYLNRQMDQNVEAGWYENDELQSIQVVPNYPAPYYNIPIPPPPPPPKKRKRYRKTAPTRVSHAPNQFVQTGVSTSQGRVRFKSQAEIIAEDRKRDARNAERRKIIRRETEPRRDSLLDSLLLARGVIDGYSSNKLFEKKAKERRSVIKRACAASQSGKGHGKRRMSFSEELQVAKDVVAPRWDYRQSMVRSMERCRNLRDQFADRQHPSLQEQIGAAKEMIVESERRKRYIPEELVWEMMAANRAPGGIGNSYSDALEKLQREQQEYLEGIEADVDEVTSPRGMSELLRDEIDASKASSGESQRLIENEVLWL